MSLLGAVEVRVVETTHVVDSGLDQLLQLLLVVSDWVLYPGRDPGGFCNTCTTSGSMYISSALVVTETHSPTPLGGTGTDVFRKSLIFLHTRPQPILFKVISRANQCAAYCTTRRKTFSRDNR